MKMKMKLNSNAINVQTGSSFYSNSLNGAAYYSLQKVNGKVNGATCNQPLNH